jgi:alcohol dehydrogenase (NADP+)
MYSPLVLLSLCASVLSQEFSVPTPPKGTQVNTIPRIGLGTARISGNTSEVIANAIVNGFRHIDCAYSYGNQKDIGVGIKEGLKRTGLSRQDLWITSKLAGDKWVIQILIGPVLQSFLQQGKTN